MMVLEAVVFLPGEGMLHDLARGSLGVDRGAVFVFKGEHHGAEGRELPAELRVELAAPVEAVGEDDDGALGAACGSTVAAPGGSKKLARRRGTPAKAACAAMISRRR